MSNQLEKSNQLMTERYEATRSNRSILSRCKNACRGVAMGRRVGFPVKTDVGDFRGVARKQTKVI